MKNIRSPGRVMLLTLVISVALLGGLFEKLDRDLHGVKSGVNLEGIPLGGYLSYELMPIIEEIAAREQRGPIEPSLDKSGNIIPERYGVEIDVEGSIRNILAASKGERISIKRRRIPPNHNHKELQGLNKTLGHFSTPVTGSYERVLNMRIACQSINYSLLWPEETFSFNQTVGPRTMADGYHRAPVMMEEELIPGVGGGVCQVATTLYNAARRARLPVIERHHHSGKVHYVKAGLDAAVAYDYMDLKFRNDYNHPVIIKCQISNSNVQAFVIGR